MCFASLVASLVTSVAFGVDVFTHRMRGRKPDVFMKERIRSRRPHVSIHVLTHAAPSLYQSALGVPNAWTDASEDVSMVMVSTTPVVVLARTICAAAAPADPSSYAQQGSTLRRDLHPARGGECWYAELISNYNRWPFCKGGCLM